MHFGLESIVPMVFYSAAIVVFLLSLFWRPPIGLYFLIPLLPMQTLRYRIGDLPLGNKFVDMMLLGVILGAVFKRQFQLPKTPLNKILLVTAIFCYVELWRGAFFLGSDLPWWFDDPRVSVWKNYMVLFVLFVTVTSVIKEARQIKIIILLMAVSLLGVDKGFYSMMSDRDLSHFSYDVREGGLLGYAGVNGLGAFEAEMLLFVLGLNAFRQRTVFRAGLWLLIGLSAYCVLFSFSREAYAGVLVGLLLLGLLKQRWVLVALFLFLLSWQTVVPTSVRERVLMTYDQNERALDNSAQERVAIWDDAMELFWSNPVLGAGFDTYEWQHRVGEFRDTHNYYLKVLVETGVLGLMLFLWLMAVAGWIGIRLFRTAQDPFLKSLGLGFCVMLSCLLVVNFFGDRWLYLQVNGFFWVILGLVVRAQVLVDQTDREAATPAPLPTDVEEPVYA